MTINLEDYNFFLPDERVALSALKSRSDARMLFSDGISLVDSKVKFLSDFLNEGDLMIFNNTKVIPARLEGFRVSRSEFAKPIKISVTLLSEVSEGIWSALVRPKKRLRNGDVLIFRKANISEELQAKVVIGVEKKILLNFGKSQKNLLSYLFMLGNMPIPPYIEKIRGVKESDHIDYQTTFGETYGAVAAPTASLHFDQEVFNMLKLRGIKTAFVTLHVGAGTFLPVTQEQLEKRKLHIEYGKISESVASLVNKTKESGKKIIAVGTTVIRLLETATNSNGKLQGFNSYTDLMITPEYKFKLCDILLTNFHLPKSSLMMLVSSFHGKNNISKLYNHAIEKDYRFYSYGDCTLLTRQNSSTLITK